MEVDQFLVQEVHKLVEEQEILRQFHQLKELMVAMDFVEVVMVKVVVVELLWQVRMELDQLEVQEEMGQEFQQLSVQMVFLVVHLDITLVVAVVEDTDLPVAVAVVDLVEKVVEELQVVVQHHQELQIVVAVVVEQMVVNLVVIMVAQAALV